MSGGERQTARKGLAIYFAILIPASAFLEWKVLQSGAAIGKVPFLILALMYVPGVASLVARLALREGFADVSFRFGGGSFHRALAIAWMYPVCVGLPAYGIAWLTGLAHLQLPLPRLLVSFVLTLTWGTLISSLIAFGEELGWRGYMLTRLIAAGAPAPIFLSGLIWAMWHVPMILSGQYATGAHPVVSAVLFVVGVIVMAYLAAYLRLQTGSIWPSVLMHGAWNATIQGTFDRATAGVPLAVGESGWLTLVFSCLFVGVVLWGGASLRGRPFGPSSRL